MFTSKTVLGIIILYAISLTHGVEYYDDYYYYYEDEVPANSGAGVEQQQIKGGSDYDIAELVKAWRDYIKEKSTLSAATSNNNNNNNSNKRNRNNNKRKKHRRRTTTTTTSRPIFEENEEYYEYEDYEEYECEPKDDTYRIPDSKQCDKYSECNIKGELKEKLCPDGLVFEIKSERCDYPAKVDCKGRPELQPPQPSKNCSRANGFFPWPAEVSCQKFYDCRGGTAYLQTCPEGVIFDPKVDACVTPDQSGRKECSGGKFLGFECPKYGPDDILRFGNHDRLPHPDNCVKFFSCLRDGRPRLGACPRKTVFNNATGHCGDPVKVPGCEDYWSKIEEDEYDAGEYYYDG